MAWLRRAGVDAAAVDLSRDKLPPELVSSAAFVAFYVWYYFSASDWWALRFLMPAFPALILAALAWTQAMSRNTANRAPLAPV